MTERWVEVPWVMSRIRRDYRDGARLLDVGSVESDYFGALATRYDVWGIDVRGEPKDRFVVADIRWSPFPDDFFDAIVCVSTIEHIGLDAYGHKHFLDPEGDRMALTEMKRIVKSTTGRILLTAPFGKGENCGWFKVYDLDGWRTLVTLPGVHVLEEEFWKIHPFPVRCRPEDLAAAGWDPEKGSAEAVVCACLCKNHSG